MGRGGLVSQLTLRNRVLDEFVHNVRELPKGSYPTSWPEYREWVAPDLGIEKIGSKSSVSETQQNELGRLDVVELLGAGKKLVSQCKVRAQGRPGGKRISKASRIERLEVRVAELIGERDRIAARYHEREADLNRAHSELLVAKAANQSLQKRVDELMRDKNSQAKNLKLVSTPSEN